MSLNKKMGNKHEEDITRWFPGARKTPGSGNQFANPMDGRQNRYDNPLAVAFDCKSTLGKSIGISREMWNKAKEQAHGEVPIIPLRFYDTDRLQVGLDLVVISLAHYREILDLAQDGLQR